MLVTVKEAEPIFPSQLDDAVTGGEAEIEFFVDRSGAVRLPRIVSASEPAFGYAACQAVAAWAFSEPRQAGAPVIVRVRRTLIFARPVERGVAPTQCRSRRWSFFISGLTAPQSPPQPVAVFRNARRTSQTAAMPTASRASRVWISEVMRQKPSARPA